MSKQGSLTEHSARPKARASSPAPNTARALASLAALALALALALPAAAHEIPATVTVRVFVKAEADAVRVLVRAPLEAMRDVDFPLRGAGYVDLARVGPYAEEAARLWLLGSLAVYEDGAPLDGRVVAARVSSPSDASFSAYDAALAHVTGAPLPPGTALPWEHALVDALIEYPAVSASADLSVRPAFAHLGLRTTTVLRYVTPQGAERALQFTGDPGLVRLDPRWHHAFLRFVALGFEHILDGIDHLLFLLCLVIPLRRVRALVLVVTAFTLGHSITLIGAALGLAPSALWFPPLIETLIAASIVFMALENIVGARTERRWAYALGFGLVHGFGFSFLLRDSLQFAGPHLLTSLLAFNIGVELGQLLVLALMVPALMLLYRYVVSERIGAIILSALVAHTAWHWMTGRGAQLLDYDWSWPALDAVMVLRWGMLALVVALAAWALGVIRSSLAGGRGTSVAAAHPRHVGGPAAAAPVLTAEGTEGAEHNGTDHDRGRVW